MYFATHTNIAKLTNEITRRNDGNSGEEAEKKLQSLSNLQMFYPTEHKLTGSWSATCDHRDNLSFTLKFSPAAHLNDE